MFKYFYKNKYNSGVTLVELMVVIVIFVIISGVVIFNYGQFRSSSSIQNLADDIALSIRKAQSYAIGVRGSGSIFDIGYGVHFTLNSETEFFYGSNKLFILFADVEKNDTYDYNGKSECEEPTKKNECLEALSITSADKISAIILYDGENKVVLDGKDTVDIVFNRPNPEPIFCYRKDSSGGGTPIDKGKGKGKGGVTVSSSCSQTVFSHIGITISNISDSSVFKTITIWNNGQISVS